MSAREAILADVVNSDLTPEQQAAALRILESNGTLDYADRLEAEQPDPRALELWSDLATDPIATYLQITDELWGTDAVPQVAAALERKILGVPDWIDDPGVQELLDAHEAKQVEQLLEELEIDRAEWAALAAAYDADEAVVEGVQDEVLDRLTEYAVDDDVIVSRTAIDPFLVAAEGDLAAAYAAYREWFRTGELPNLSDAFLRVAAGDAEQAADAEERWRAEAWELRDALRAKRQEVVAAAHAKTLPPLGAHAKIGGADYGEALDALHSGMVASAKLRDADESGQSDEGTSELRAALQALVQEGEDESRRAD